MTLESYSATAIATLGDWLKNLVPVFQPMRNKIKTIVHTISYIRWNLFLSIVFSISRLKANAVLRPKNWVHQLHANNKQKSE